MKREMTALAGLALSLLAAVQIASAAAPTISAAIAARKANFKEIGGAFKTINDEIKSGAPDVNTVRPLARDIASRSALQLKNFPRGSGPESGVKTRAKAAIWSDQAGFNKLQNDMVASASTRAALGATCKNCHDRFREEE
jgi:cytochrome c556